MNVEDFENRLGRLAERRLGGPLLNLLRLTGGASQQLWSFDVADGGQGRGYVLRRSPGGELSDRLDTIGLETEALVIEQVHAHGAAVPAVAYVLSPDDGLGRGFIAARMPGEALGKRIVTSPAFAEIRPRLAEQCGQILAAIHQTPLDGLPPLPDRTPVDSILQLEQQLRSFNEPRPVFEAAIVWLRRHCPAAAEPRLVHGDFRTGNFLLEPGGISAVLDWEGCHLGDPMEDLGWLCMPIWRFGRLDLPVGGFGRRKDLYEGYRRAGGNMVDPSRVRFWEVRGMLRWGLTTMAMAQAFAAGDRSIERAAVGRRGSEAELELLHAMSGSDLDA